MLPHVVRWNAEVVGDRYADLLRASGRSATHPGEALAGRLEDLARAGGLPTRLRDAGVRHVDLESLSVAAGKQWTGTFNPRAFDAGAAMALYDRAF
jgi:alcohol dehydrogenase